MRRKGFTLIEILVVVAILVLLMSILFPVFRSAKQRVQQVVCFSNERQIGVATRLYTQDNDDYLPIGAYNTLSALPTRQWDRTWSDLLLPYLNGSPAILTCPLASPGGTAYGCNPWLAPYYWSYSLATIGDGGRIWVSDHQTADWPIYPWDYRDSPLHPYLTPRHNSKVDVLFLDGHTAARSPASLALGSGLWQR